MEHFTLSLALALSLAPAAPPAPEYRPPNNPTWPGGRAPGAEWPPAWDLVRFPPAWMCEQRRALFESRAKDLWALLEGGLVAPAAWREVERLAWLADGQAHPWEHLCHAHRAARLNHPATREYGVRYHLDDLRIALGPDHYARGLMPDCPE